MKETGKSEFKDLANRKTKELYLNSWTDDEIVFLDIGFITMSIPLHEFGDFYDFIKETHDKLEWFL